MNLPSAAYAELRSWLGHTEDEAWGRARIADYWKRVGQPFPGSDVPWSAVFVAYLTAAVAPGALALTAAHIWYVREALRRKIANRPGYWAFDPRTTSPAVGDIVVRSRGLSPTTWEDIVNGTGGFRETHGDIVVVRAAGAIQAIGGNAGSTTNPQGVQARDYPLDGAGMLLGDRWIAVLKLSAFDEERTPVTLREPVSNVDPLSLSVGFLGPASSLGTLSEEQIERFADEFNAPEVT